METVSKSKRRSSYNQRTCFSQAFIKTTGKHRTHRSRSGTGQVSSQIIMKYNAATGSRALALIQTSSHKGLNWDTFHSISSGKSVSSLFHHLKLHRRSSRWPALFYTRLVKPRWRRCRSELWLAVCVQVSPAEPSDPRWASWTRRTRWPCPKESRPTAASMFSGQSVQHPCVQPLSVSLSARGVSRQMIHGFTGVSPKMITWVEKAAWNGSDNTNPERQTAGDPNTRSSGTWTDREAGPVRIRPSSGNGDGSRLKFFCLFLKKKENWVLTKEDWRLTEDWVTAY